MTTAARLTDEVIDGLSGRDLDRAVSNAAGHYCGPGNTMVRIEGHGISDLTFYHRDLGAAMGLLLQFREEIKINLYKDGVNVLAQMPGAFKVIATGSHEQMATVICRAFLKLKNRS